MSKKQPTMSAPAGARTCAIATVEGAGGRLRGFEIMRTGLTRGEALAGAKIGHDADDVPTSSEQRRLAPYLRKQGYVLVAAFWQERSEGWDLAVEAAL